MRIPMLLVVAALASQGCVSKSKYTELQTKLEQCREKKKDDDRESVAGDCAALRLTPAM